MSDTKLKVGDVCFDPLALKVGVRVSFKTYVGPQEGTIIELRVRGEDIRIGEQPHRTWYLPAEMIRRDGVTILTLPEEAPAAGTVTTLPEVAAGKSLSFYGAQLVPIPAAPSPESLVPVGSRWRWKNPPGLAPIRVTTVNAGPTAEYVYEDDGYTGAVPFAHLLAHATRIDEPAGTGKKRCPYTWSYGGETKRCSLDAGHEGNVHSSYSLGDEPAAPKPALPPARCAPGCTPVRACRITIPVTDEGTRYECPAFAEDKCDIRDGWGSFREGVEDDQREARSMRDQRWEARSPMVGRYRFNRR